VPLGRTGSKCRTRFRCPLWWGGVGSEDKAARGSVTADPPERQ
jgi:hypothetical protein